MEHGLPVPPKTLEVSFGEFVCPTCRRTTTYKHKEQAERRLFHLIPFLGRTLKEYVECQTCMQKFTMDVLRTGLSQDVEQILGALKEKLSSGTSLEEAQTFLTDKGLDARTVKRYVSVAAGIALKHCRRCHLTFRDGVLKCHKCGDPLP